MLFFDIETKANSVALQFMKQPMAPGNYKDPEKIQKYINNKKVEMVKKAALDSDYGYIAAIGYQEDERPVQSITINEMAEKDMIEIFWSKFRNHNGHCCGYNIIGFDLPYLMRRSFDIGFKILDDDQFMQLPSLARYQVAPICDLMGILYNWNSFKGLKWVAERYKLNNPLPELEGSQVENMDNETLKAYVENDVMLVKQLYSRMNGIYF